MKIINLNKRRILAVFVASLMLAACTRVLPIYNVEDAPIFTASGDELSLRQVRKAIIRAVVAKTWSVERDDDGQIEASLAKGKKIVNIIIDYSIDYYSITYKDSINLLQEGNVIHKRYNSWIRGLRHKIDEYLSLL